MAPTTGLRGSGSDASAGPSLRAPAPIQGPHGQPALCAPVTSAALPTGGRGRGDRGSAGLMPEPLSPALHGVYL